MKVKYNRLMHHFTENELKFSELLEGKTTSTNSLSMVYEGNCGLQCKFDEIILYLIG